MFTQPMTRYQIDYNAQIFGSSEYYQENYLDDIQYQQVDTHTWLVRGGARNPAQLNGWLQNNLGANSSIQNFLV